MFADVARESEDSREGDPVRARIGPMKRVMALKRSKSS
jgi:hypothetical protein